MHRLISTLRISILRISTRRTNTDAISTDGMTTGGATAANAGSFSARRGFLVLFAAIVILAGATAWFVIWNARQVAFQEDQHDATNLALVLAEQTERYIQTIDLTILEVKSWASELDRQDPATFSARMRSADVHQRMAERRASILEARAIMLIAADGEVLDTSGPAIVSTASVADHEYYKYLKSHSASDLVVGLPTTAQAGGYRNLFFARRVTGPDGTFLGMVVGVVDASYLSNFYRSISERVAGAVTLLSRDGTVLVRYPDWRASLGRRYHLPRTGMAGLRKAAAPTEHSV